MRKKNPAEAGNYTLTFLFVPNASFFNGFSEASQYLLEQLQPLLAHEPRVKAETTISSIESFFIGINFAGLRQILCHLMFITMPNSCMYT